MTFPLWYALLPYALVLLGTSIFMFFNLYHVAKFGVQSFGTTALLLTYLIGYIAVLAFSAVLISGYDWSAAVTLSDILPFVGNSSSDTNFGL